MLDGGKGINSINIQYEKQSDELLTGNAATYCFITGDDVLSGLLTGNAARECELFLI
jgi:hypothetical protein